MEDLDFNQWTEDSHFTKDSIKALRTHKMTDYECLINVKSGELKRAGLALGQEICMRTALAKLGNLNFVEGATQSTPNTPARTVQNTSRLVQEKAQDRDQEQDQDQDERQELDQDPILMAGAKLDALLKDSPGVSRVLSVPSKVAPLPSEYDPRILLSAKASSKKAEKITSFLHEKVKDRIQRARKDCLILTQGEDGSISMKNNDKESFYISMSESGAANMRLMNHILQNGDLPRDQVE